MTILGFALCVCISLHENARADVLVQAKNLLTLYVVSSGGRKWIARKERGNCIPIICPPVLSLSPSNKGFPECVVVCSVEVSESLKLFTQSYLNLDKLLL